MWPMGAILVRIKFKWCAYYITTNWMSLQLAESVRHVPVPVGALVKRAAYIVHIMSVVTLMRIKSRPNWRKLKRYTIFSCFCWLHLKFSAWNSISWIVCLFAKVQSFFRGWLCRRRWKQIVDDYINSPHAESMRKRNSLGNFFSRYIF